MPWSPPALGGLPRDPRWGSESPEGLVKSDAKRGWWLRFSPGI